MDRNYGPTTNPGDIRTRIRKIEGFNENASVNVDAVPYMVYEEETAVRLSAPTSTGATEASLGFSAYIQQMYSPGETIQIRNPNTDAVGAVGRVPAELTMAEAFAVVYSLGRHAQTVRDAAEAAAAT